MDAESQDSGSPVKDTKSTKAKKSTAPKKVTAKKDTKDKKTKKDGKTKDPGAPKKPRSSYLIYSIEQREVLKKENSDLKATEQIKVIAERWRALSDDQKKQYIEKATEDKKRYEDEMKKFNENGGNKRKKDADSEDQEEEEEEKVDKGKDKKKKETTKDTKKEATKKTKPALPEKLENNFDLKRYLASKQEAQDSPSTKKGRR